MPPRNGRVAFLASMTWFMCAAPTFSLCNQKLHSNTSNAKTLE